MKTKLKGASSAVNNSGLKVKIAVKSPFCFFCFFYRRWTLYFLLSLKVLFWFKIITPLLSSWSNLKTILQVYSHWTTFGILSLFQSIIHLASRCVKIMAKLYWHWCTHPHTSSLFFSMDRPEAYLMEYRPDEEQNTMSWKHCLVVGRPSSGKIFLSTLEVYNTTASANLVPGRYK